MRPHVVWVAPSVPDHQGGGDQLRQAFLLDRVAQTCDVRLVVPAPVTDAVVAAAVTGIDVVAVPPAGPPSRRQRVRDLVTPGDPLLDRRAGPTRAALADVVAAQAATADVVMVEHLELARLREHLPDVPCILTVHLAHSRHLAHLAATVSGRQRWFWQVQARRAARLEAWAGRAYDRVVAVSDQDAEVLTGDVVVVPNGVEVSRPPAPLPPAPHVVVTGSFDFAPNVDGITWFLDHAWERVRANVPDATLAVVGRRPPPVLADRIARASGVTLHADVAAIEPYLDAARVVLVPIRVGAGTRLKALQGMAAGRVVVGTSIGLEGLGVRHGDTAWVADRPDDLAAGVVAGLRDPAMAAVAAAGRTHVVARFGWDAVARPLIRVLGELSG